MKEIINKNTEILICGSYPGEISLKKQQYYANPSNDFWKVMEKLLNIDLLSLSYDKKIDCLLKNKIGLWDVYKKVIRKGSMDSQIANFEYNDFKNLHLNYPSLKIILLAGKEAFKSFESLDYVDLKYAYIPSTSAANRKISIKDKAKFIKELIKKWLSLY